MKNWIRVTFIFSVLIGGTALFGYYSFSGINNAFDNISASYITISNTPLISLSNKTKEKVATTSPDTSPDNISTSTTSTATSTATDLNLSIDLPKNNNEFYIGCTYQLSLQSSTTIDSLEAVLIDAGTQEVSGPIASGLAGEYEIKPDSQSLDWKVGVVWPGEYFILVSKINGIEKEIKSKYFMINKMTEGISANERENICK